MTLGAVMKPFRKESTQYSRHSLGMVSRVVLVAALAVVAVAAQAQSLASSYGQISFSVKIDPNSSASAQNLSITDHGYLTYNLVGPGGAYASHSGVGSASASVDPGTYFDGTNGYTSTSSSAQATSGKATASVGSQENLQITNSGTTTIFLDISALATTASMATMVGAVTASNYANLKTYIGIYDFNITAVHAVANPLILTSGSADMGLTTTATADWTPVNIFGTTFYSGAYLMAIGAGESHALEFYTSGKDFAGAPAAVPSPAAALPMLASMVSLAIRRRQAKA